MAARITPYEALLPQLDTSTFPAVRHEAEQRGVDPRDRDRFVLLGAVGACMRDLIPDDAPPDAVEQYGELLYHAYQFWDSGRRLYVLTPAALDRLAAPGYSLGSWTLSRPAACYVQFPAQAWWARVGPDAPFEPVDGCFVVVGDAQSSAPPGVPLRILLILGLRPERPGVSLVPYAATVDPRSPASRADQPWREGGEAFANAIPGGERRGLRAIITTSELEAIVLRILHELDRHPERLHARAPEHTAGSTMFAYTEIDSVA